MLFEIEFEHFHAIFRLKSDDQLMLSFEQVDVLFKAFWLLLISFLRLYCFGSYFVQLLSPISHKNVCFFVKVFQQGFYNFVICLGHCQVLWWTSMYFYCDWLSQLCWTYDWRLKYFLQCAKNCGKGKESAKLCLSCFLSLIIGQF